MNRYFRWAIITATFLVVLCVGTRESHAKPKVHQWQQGVLIGVDKEDVSALSSLMRPADGIVRTLWIYTVDDGHLLWKLSRLTKKGEKIPLDAAINGPIEFAIEGQTAYLKNDKGEVLSLTVDSKALKTTTTQ